MQLVSNLGGVVLLRMVSQQWYGILVFTLAVSCMAAGETSEGHRRAQELAHHYEIVHVDTSYHLHHVGRQRRSSDGESYAHPDRTQFEVSAFGNNFKLDLELNKILLPKKFQVRSYSANDELVINRNVVNCYYQGKVSGFNSSDDSHAVVSTCNGISGSFGVGQAGHRTDDHTFFIEPLTSVPSVNGTHQHVVFKDKDAKSSKRDRKCSATHSTSRSRWQEARRPTSYKKSMSHRRQRRQAQTTQMTNRYVELMLVMDHSLYVQFNYSIAALTSWAFAITNEVDAVYQSLQFRILLVGLDVFNTGDRFVTSINAVTMLDNFLAYRTASLMNIFHDNAQMITGLNFNGSTIGLAPLEGMCAQFDSGGVNQYGGAIVADTASTVSHELGHNLGMEHDNISCNCADADGCIMAASAPDIAPTLWSSCSKANLARFLQEGGGRCLSNLPTQTLGNTSSPACGNGVVEGAEQCDCGGPTKCTNRCCNATSCLLTSGSQCSDGPCCNNFCQYSAAGTVCRSMVSSCDVAEKCSGQTHTCPDNIFIQNGQSCGSGVSASFCYFGRCRTHSAQCKRTFGQSAEVAPQQCYDENIRGTESSNCGSTYDDINDNEFHVQCPMNSVRCGLLKCVNGSQFNLLDATLITSISNVSINGSSVICKSVTTFPDEDDILVGLTYNGVKCAANSICIDQVCTSTASLGVTPCPSHGGRVCSGNGVCTNLNSCFCNTGWTGSDCSRTCTMPTPRNGGRPCSGETSQEVQCVCVDGGLTQWSGWSGNCPADRNQSRIRFCTNPAPVNGGANCSGETQETRICGQYSTWSSWTAVGNCSLCIGTSLVKHYQSRSRSCSIALNESCSLELNQTRLCPDCAHSSSNSILSSRGLIYCLLASVFVYCFMLY